MVLSNANTLNVYEILPLSSSYKHIRTFDLLITLYIITFFLEARKCTARQIDSFKAIESSKRLRQKSILCIHSPIFSIDNDASYIECIN